MIKYLNDVVFFFNDTATTEIYTLSLHDALPIWSPQVTFEQLIENMVQTDLQRLQSGQVALIE